MVIIFAIRVLFGSFLWRRLNY